MTETRDELKNAVGQTIKNIRIKKGLSQDVLSGLSDLDRSHLTKIESGKKLPNLETIWKIANAVEIDPSNLISLVERQISSKDMI